MRDQVKNIYDRQVARCLRDIEEMDFKVPAMVIERFKRAVEYAVKDTDKINNKESGYGTETRGNR